MYLKIPVVVLHVYNYASLHSTVITIQTSHCMHMYLSVINFKVYIVCHCDLSSQPLSRLSFKSHCPEVSME